MARDGVSGAQPGKIRGVDAGAAVERVVTAITEQLVVTGKTRENVVEISARQRLGRRGSGSVNARIGHAAEHHVRGAGIQSAVRTRVRSADNQIGKAVAVHIAGRGDRKSACVVGRLAWDVEAVGAVKRQEVDSRAEARRLAENDVGRARSRAVHGSKGSTYQQIVEAVAIDIACRRYREPAIVAGRLADDAEAVAAVYARKLKIRAESRRLAEDDIGRTRVRTVDVRSVGANDQVAKAVPVDVARGGGRNTAEIVVSSS